MGLFSSFFKKAGKFHVHQLVVDCGQLVIKASMSEINQKNNPYLTDSALDLLIKEGNFNTMRSKKYKSLLEKYRNFAYLYVCRELGRPIDTLAGEMDTFDEFLEKTWAILKTTKDGVDQTLKHNA